MKHEIRQQWSKELDVFKRRKSLDFSAFSWLLLEVPGPSGTQIYRRRVKDWVHKVCIVFFLYGVPHMVNWEDDGKHAPDERIWLS